MPYSPWWTSHYCSTRSFSSLLSPICWEWLDTGCLLCFSSTGQLSDYNQLCFHDVPSVHTLLNDTYTHTLPPWLAHNPSKSQNDCRGRSRRGLCCVFDLDHRDHEHHREVSRRLGHWPFQAAADERQHFHSYGRRNRHFRSPLHQLVRIGRRLRSHRRVLHRPLHLTYLRHFGWDLNLICGVDCLGGDVNLFSNFCGRLVLTTSSELLESCDCLTLRAFASVCLLEGKRVTLNQGRRRGSTRQSLTSPSPKGAPKVCFMRKNAGGKIEKNRENWGYNGPSGGPLAPLIDSPVRKKLPDQLICLTYCLWNSCWQL